MSLRVWNKLTRVFSPAVERPGTGRRRTSRLGVEALEDRWLLAVFTVTTVADSGAGSLRQAILDANATAGQDTIQFAIPGTGNHLIQPTSALPTITDAVIINGYTQAGSSPNTNGPGASSNAVITIQLDGSQLSGEFTGLVITAGNSTVKGLSITGFVEFGLHFATNGGNTIQGDSIKGNSQGNLVIDDGDSNTIGGLTAAARNTLDSIALNTSNNTVQNNETKGMTVSGSSNTIGGTTPEARNIFSGNITYGINIGGSNNLVQGNYIGTDITGTVAIGNRRAGVFITGTNNSIGGTAAGAGNVISGNGRGVYLFGGNNNTVQGNLIGTNAAGTAVLGNSGEGFLITSGAANNLIGGTTAAAANTLAGNHTGVTLFQGATGNMIQGNHIGTLADGSTPAGNTFAGVLAASTASENTIGGTIPGAGNLIANTQGDGTAGSGSGVLVEADPTITPPINNAILGNSITANFALGIDLTRDQTVFGVTPNDSGDKDTGGNNLQNFPTLTSATSSGGVTTIRGTLNSRANTTYRIEFFSSPTSDATGFGEGARFLGFVSVRTNSTGNASFTATLAISVTPGQVISATATDPAGNTSEFSRTRAITATGPTALAGPNMPAQDHVPFAFLLADSVSTASAKIAEPPAPLKQSGTAAAGDNGLPSGPKALPVFSVHHSEANPLTVTDAAFQEPWASLRAWLECTVRALVKLHP